MKYHAEYRDQNDRPRYFAGDTLADARGWCVNMLSYGKEGDRITIWILGGRIDKRAGIVRRYNNRALYEDCMNPKEHKVYRLKRNGTLDIQVAYRDMHTDRYEKLDLTDVLGKPKIHL